MLLKSLIPGQDVEFEFKLSDCPVIVAGNRIAVTGSHLSPLLQKDLIVRGDEVTGVFEGDQVFSNGILLGTVIYSKGLKVQKLDGSLERLSCMEHIQMVKGSRKDIESIVKVSSRTPLNIVYKNKLLEIGCIVERVNEQQFAFYDVKHLVEMEDFDFFTGYASEDGTNIRFGQILHGGIVCLYKGDVCIDYCDKDFPIPIQDVE